MTSFHHLDQYTAAVSEITGRTIYINNALDKYLISPEWDAGVSSAICKRWIGKIDAQQPVHKPPPLLRKAVAALGACETRVTFGEALDAMLGQEFTDRLETSSIAKAQRFLVELMLWFWSEQQVAWPAKQQVPFSLPYLKLDSPGFTGPQLSLLERLRAYLNRGGPDDASNFRFILDHILARVGVQEIGDLTPTTFYLQLERCRMDKMRSSGIQGVIYLLRESHHDQAIGWTPGVFGFFKGRMGGLARDSEYKWLLSKDSKMKEWVRLVKEHLASTPANFRKRRSSLNVLLKHFLEHPELPRNPVAYFDIKTKPSVLFNIPDKKGRQTMSVIHEFLNEALLKTCSQTDDNETPLLMPGFANPLPKPNFRFVNYGETHRETMPTRLINLAMRVLTENDFAWAKEAGRIQDAFRWMNPETGEFENMWAPVRAYAILIKLLLPARTYQVRHLDSGEGDTLRYLATGEWVRNTGPHRPAGHEPVERGVFRRYKRKDGTEGAVFYFNTNKTADIDAPTRGYVMPWEKLDALRLFAELRDWQEKYNPVQAPTPWTDIPELKLDKHADDLAKMGSNYFLLRDPSNRTRPDAPVTDVRLRDLWLKLMDEVEKRLAAATEVLPDGSPIKLVLKRDKRGQPASTVFDLHTLRVTIITAMYEEGVPPEFLMKIVGHATVLMTLYYTKLHAQTISLRLDEALVERQRKSQSEMTGFLKRASRQELEKAVAFRHPSALDALSSGTGLGMAVMDHGICPTAAKRCHEGLAVVDPGNNNQKFQPVPGGATNCTRCRFFVTGPAFLFGLEAHVNDLAYRLKKASYAYEKAQTHLDSLSDEFALALEAKQPFYKQRELEIAETAFEASTAEVDGIALSLQAAYALTEQCIRISQDQSDSTGVSLVAVGGTEQIEAVLSEGHEFDQLNRICQSATFFEGLKINWQQPNLERARLFDRMLRNSGHEPRFSLLDDDVALKVANAMGQFLYARLEVNTVHALVDGRTTLRAVGLDKAFISQLDTIEPKQLSYSATSALVLEQA